MAKLEHEITEQDIVEDCCKQNLPSEMMVALLVLWKQHEVVCFELPNGLLAWCRPEPTIQ